MFYFILIIFGLIFGSFLGMLTYRLPRGEKFSGLPAQAGRSYCPSCKQKIEWRHNVPLLSYFLLHGKCASCNKKISPRYPTIEAFTSLSFLATGFLWSQQSSDPLLLLLYILLLLIFLALIIIDFEHQILPDSLLVLLLLLTLLILLAAPSPAFFTHLTTGTLTFCFFLALYLITRGRGMGYGDVKLSFIMGSFFGFPGVLVWTILAFVSGAIVGILLLIAGRATFGKPIPFGPFLLVSAWFTIFFGNTLWTWYLSFFNGYY